MHFTVTDYSKDLSTLSKAALLSLRDLANEEMDRLLQEVKEMEVHLTQVTAEIKLRRDNTGGTE